MKKHLIVSVVAISLLVAIVGITIFANNSRILTPSTPVDLNQTYVENATTSSKEDIIQIANQLLDKYNITVPHTENASIEVKQYTNNLKGREETSVSSKDYIVTYNTTTQDFISYINNKTSFEKVTMGKSDIKAVALEIFNNIKSDEFSNYTLTFLEAFDDEIYRAKFTKKYGDLLNNAESISFSFAPQSKEIVTFAVNRCLYADNEIIITEIEAREIASNFKNIYNSNKVTVKIEIVKPNHFYSEISEENKLYKDSTVCRKAYVIYANDIVNTRIYVDCTTGEIIGGDQNL